MIKKHITELEPGMILAKHVDDLPTATKLISENTVLDKEIIRKMFNYNIDYVYVYKEDNLLCQERKEDREKDLKVKYDKLSAKMDKVFNSIKYGRRFNILEIHNELTGLINTVTQHNNIFSRIRELEEKQDYTFNHSLNVAMLATMLGKWLGYNEVEIKQIAMAGLLHDIGKLSIPDEILNKPGKLTEEEFEIMKEHPVHGYNILKDAIGISENVALGVLQHHEREDGSGYPLGLKGDEIHEYAKVIAVCDVYDAITSDKVYKEKSSPLRAAEILEEESFNYLDPRITTTFINKMTKFYVGCRVVLSDGKEGDIVYIHPHAPTKPIVKVGEEFINFLEPQNIQIIDIIK